jgi:hypothetical protein
VAKYILAAGLLFCLSACNSESDSGTIAAHEVLPSYDVTLSWTAVGDDGQIGRASAYDLRYAADSAVLRSNWQQAQLVSYLPIPAPAGSAEHLETAIPLQPNQKYFFAVKARDEAGNWSPISNIHVFVADDSLLTKSKSSANQ